MASASTLTTLAYILKRLYSKERPENLAKRERVWLSKCPRLGGFYGQNLTVPIRTGNAQGVSASFPKAKLNASATTGYAWLVTRSKKYGFATIDAEAIASTENDEGAFVEAVKEEVDSMLDEMGRRLSLDLYGDGSGCIGKIASVAGNVITLVTVDDAKNFDKDQKLQANPNKTGNVGTLRASIPKVTVVDEDLGKITVDAIGTFVANDFLYNDGDYDQAIKGLQAHLPILGPQVGDSFYGVDRTAHPSKLAGCVQTDTGSVEETIQRLGSKIRKRGGRPRLGLMNPEVWTDLSIGMSSKVSRDQGGTAVMGFDYITLAHPAGHTDFYADPDCPIGEFYMLTPETWKLRHLRNVPHIVMDDGLRSLRQTDDDGIEIRGRQWCALVNKAPGWNGVGATGR